MNDKKYKYNSDGTISFQYENEEYFCLSSFPSSDLEESEFSLVFLDSAYYQSEDDIHPVYLKSEKRIVGVIIPLSFLSEQEHDIIDGVEPFFQQYADLAIRKILSSDYIKEVDNYQFTIDKLFPLDNNLSIFVFDKSLLAQDIFKGYLPSLYDAGYCYVKDPHKKGILYTSNLRKNEIGEKKSQKQKKIYIYNNYDYSRNESFYNELFMNVLPCNINPLYRYIMLYQTIEIFSGYASYNKFIEASEKYSNNQISKNDLREQIQSSVRDKVLINEIFKNIGTEGGVYDQFKTSVKNLFVLIGYDCKDLNNYGEYMYALRNRIVHETRSLVAHLDKMKEIVDLYEKTTIELLKNSEKIKISSKKISVTQ